MLSEEISKQLVVLVNIGDMVFGVKIAFLDHFVSVLRILPGCARLIPRSDYCQALGTDALPKAR